MRLPWIAGFAALAAASYVGVPGERAPRSPSIARQPVAPALHFERNDGQTDPRVAFVARPRGATLFVERGGATFAFRDAAVRMRLIGARADAPASGLGQLSGRANYLRGSDPSRWTTDVPLYSRVEAAGVYPGIDLAWYGTGRDAEYDFAVAPGADAGAIAMAFDGADSVCVEDGGDLVVRVAGHELRHCRPTVYEETGGGRRPVDGRFVLRDDRVVAFEVPGRDPANRLVIDPLAIAWSDYLGGGGYDTPAGVGVDGSKNPYVAGSTGSLDFPVSVGAFDTTSTSERFVRDVFVAKYKADGTAITYATYIGGSNDDQARGVAVSTQGVVTVVGVTSSEDFPTSVSAFDRTPGDGVNDGGYYSDGFVTRLNAAGSGLEWSSYLGGVGQEEANDVAVDAAGLAYVVGSTGSGDFPVSPSTLQATGGTNSLDAFLSVFASNGQSLSFSTYLGGPEQEHGHGVAIDTDGNVWVAGSAGMSANDPVSFTGTPAVRAFAGFNDAFVLKITSARQWGWFTFLGGQYDELTSSYHEPRARIAVDTAGRAYVCGNTSSDDFPVGSSGSVSNATQESFVTRLSTSGAIDWSRLVGTDSGSEEAPVAIVVDGSNRAHIAGYTAFGTFPTTSDAVQPAPVGASQDAYYAVVKADGSGLDYATLLGGAADDEATGLALVSDGSVYVVGTTSGDGGARHFPIVGGVQKFAGAQGEGFVTKYTTGPGGKVDEFKVLKGVIKDSPKFFKDTAEFGGTLPLPADFDPRTVPLTFSVTDGSAGQQFDIYVDGVVPQDPRWKLKKGKYTLKWEIADGIHVVLVIDVKKGLFAFTAKEFSFSQPFVNPVKVSVSFGQSLVFETTQTWSQKGTKFFLK